MAKNRLEAFSDGVIAIMAPEFKVPHSADFRADTVMARLHALRAQLHLRRDVLEQVPVWMLPIVGIHCSNAPHTAASH